MANLSGKTYALTAFTRMPPLKTFGLRIVFALIRLSLKPPAIRGFVSGVIIGAVTVIVLEVLHTLGLATDAVMREGAWLIAPGVVAWFVGLAIHLLGFGIVGAIVGYFYQPTWSILGRIGTIQKNLVDLSFIHFARWVIVPRNAFPRLAESQPSEHLHYDYLMFESNFNGTWEKYIDAFSQVVPGGMDNIWRWSVKYPGSRPISPFLTYIRNCQYDTDYYYSAYPGASTNDIRAALRLTDEITKFVETSATLSAPEFARAYNRFLSRVQNCLSKTDSGPASLPGLPAYDPIAPLSGNAQVAHV
ncbi:MAG: hypothetical protein ABI314_01955 [Gemmatimonadaceae bacterium]